MGSGDTTSNNPGIQNQPAPAETPKETPQITPAETGKFSSGGPKSSTMTTGDSVVPGAKIYKD